LLNVLLTVDVELWPSLREWPDTRLQRPLTQLTHGYEQCILGRTASGDYGLAFIIETLSRHSLRAIFFVEALHASAGAMHLLERTVQMIRGAGQEVQLHVHTEWLSDITAPDLPARHRRNLADFSVQEQISIIQHAHANLQKAGAPRAIALRAGNMGASFDTPFAAQGAGLSLDMSFDPARNAQSREAVLALRRLAQPGAACPTLPVSCIEDFPGHHRTAQLAAVSFLELRGALEDAALAGWSHFVILMHSFELIKRAEHEAKSARPHAVNVARFQKLCGFLAENRSAFRTTGCADVNGPSTCWPAAQTVRTRTAHSLLRLGEQAVSRLF
jgi:hypothetical protein